MLAGDLAADPGGLRVAEVAGELQFALLRHAGDPQPALIGIAGQRHVAAAAEEFGALARGWTDLAEVRDAEVLQAGVQDLPTGGGIEPAERGRIGDRRPVRNGHAAQQPHGLARRSPPDHGRRRGAGILRGQLQRPGQAIHAAPENDHHRLPMQPARLPLAPDGISRALQTGKRLRLRTGVSIASVGSNVEFRPADALAEERYRGGDKDGIDGVHLHAGC